MALARHLLPEGKGCHRDSSAEVNVAPADFATVIEQIPDLKICPLCPVLIGAFISLRLAEPTCSTQAPEVVARSRRESLTTRRPPVYVWTQDLINAPSMPPPR